MKEYRRQQCPFKSLTGPANSSSFTVYDNSKFELCHSYPTKLLFPGKAYKSIIEASGKYRSSNRLPGFTYYDHVSKTSIWRCSQPKPGFFSNRNREDEELLKHIGAMSASGRCAIYDARS